MSADDYDYTNRGGFVRKGSLTQARQIGGIDRADQNTANWEAADEKDRAVKAKA